MTREEAKGNLIHAIRWKDMPSKEALEMAIKALEQEPVLDKIRDEILDNAFLVVNPKNTYEFISAIDLDDIDKILDKYKEEGNDKK